MKRSYLVEGDTSLDVDNIAIELRPLSHVSVVTEYECLVHIESTCDDVFGVLSSQLDGLFAGESLPQRLLIICQLDYQRHVEYFLQQGATPLTGKTCRL